MQRVAAETSKLPLEPEICPKNAACDNRTPAGVRAEDTNSVAIAHAGGIGRILYASCLRCCEFRALGPQHPGSMWGFTKNGGPLT